MPKGPMLKIELLRYLNEMDACPEAVRYIRRLKIPLRTFWLKRNTEKANEYKDWFLCKLGNFAIPICREGTCDECDDTRKSRKYKNTLKYMEDPTLVEEKLRKKFKKLNLFYTKPLLHQ